MFSDGLSIPDGIAPSVPFDNDVFFLLNESDFGDFNGNDGMGTPNRIAFFNSRGAGGNGNPPFLGLPTYDFPANRAGPKDQIKVFVQDMNTSIYVSSLTVRLDPALVPIPPAALLLLTGLGGLALVARRGAPA